MINAMKEDDESMIERSEPVRAVKETVPLKMVLNCRSGGQTDIC